MGNCSSLSALQMLPAVTKGIKEMITGWAQLFAMYNPSALVGVWKGKAGWLSSRWDIGKAARGSGAKQRKTPSKNTKAPGRRRGTLDRARRS